MVVVVSTIPCYDICNRTNKQYLSILFNNMVRTTHTVYLTLIHFKEIKANFFQVIQQK